MCEELKEIRVNRPDVSTKQLKFNVVSGKRKGRLSSNLVTLYGFDENSRVIERSLGRNKGIEVRLASEMEIAEGRTKKVYSRSYKNRSSSPLNPTARRKERIIEFSSQRLIDYSFPSNCEHMHIKMTYGSIVFTPLEKKQYDLVQEINSPEDLINTAVMFSGGVDSHLLESDGFKNQVHIEWRPNSKRDGKTDYTEFTSLTTIVNSSPRMLINEDVYSMDIDKVKDLMNDQPITFLHASLPCEEFSKAKSSKAKQDAVEDMSSTLDAFIPMLEVLDATRASVLLIENVEGMRASAIYDVLKLQLKRRGFATHCDLFDARDYGGFTSRKRMYLVASTLDSEFAFPKPTFCRTDVWKECIELHWDEIEKMDVTDTKVVQDAIKGGWNRPIREDKYFANTLMRSNSQGPKDRLTIEKDGRVYNVPLSVQRKLNSIPDTFDVEWASLDKASQVFGASICCVLHSAIMRSVRKHILAAARAGQVMLSNSRNLKLCA